MIASCQVLLFQPHAARGLLARRVGAAMQQLWIQQGHQNPCLPWCHLGILHKHVCEQKRIPSPLWLLC